MRTHAEENGILQTSMPCIGSEWNVVRQRIQDTFRTSPVGILYLKEELGSAPSPQATAAANPLVKAQQADESLRHVREWIRKGYTPQHKELQGLPRLEWKLYNQLASLYLHVDATFETVPVDLYQLLIIHCLVLDTIIPVFYVFMSGKTRLLYVYDAVFLKIRSLAPQFNPEISVSDFEIALYSSIGLSIGGKSVEGGHINKKVQEKNV